MVAELSANHRTSKMFLEIARQLTGHFEVRKPRGSLLAPLREVGRRLVGRGR
jgi:pilus assembly protein CpaE